MADNTGRMIRLEDVEGDQDSLLFGSRKTCHWLAEMLTRGRFLFFNYRFCEVDCKP